MLSGTTSLSSRHRGSPLMGSERSTLGDEGILWEMRRLGLSPLSLFLHAF